MFGLPVNLTFRWANLGKKGKHVSLIFLGLHCVGPNFEQLTMMVKLLLLSSRLRRYCQIFIEYISAIDDKDLWYGYFCRNLIEWKRTECDNWAKEDQVVAETFGRIEQKSQIREVALLNQLVSVDQQIEGWKADHTSAALDHPDWPEADAASDFYITDLGLSLGWTGHYLNQYENKLLLCVMA